MQQNLIKTLFTYQDGKLFWKVNPVFHRQSLKGKEAGHLTNRGYIRTSYLGEQYQLHRLIYTMHYGDIPEGMLIDHINRNRLDNRIENLRCVTPKGNQQNRSKESYKRKPSLYKGYYFRPHVNKFYARFTVKGVRKNIGYYTTECGARLAVMQERLLYNLGSN